MPLTTYLVVAQPETHSTPLLAIALPQGEMIPSLRTLDPSTGGALGRLIASGDFSGKKDQVAVLYPSGNAQRLLVVGLGKQKDITRALVRRAAAIAAKRARTLGATAVSFWLPPESRAAVSVRDAAQAVAEGVVQGAWHYDEMKRPPEDPRPELERGEVLVSSADRAEAEEGHRIGAAIGQGQALARGLQVLPGNVCTPTYLGNTAGELAKRYGFGVTVLDLKAIEKEGMGGLLCVARGSTEEPRFIVLEYNGATAPPPKGPAVLIGKGVTFDTGGISIKPAQNMEDMKFDMSGAAAVLGTFEVLGRLKPKVHVVGLIPSTENMPAGNAVKPGDVVKSHLGKTIEIINTDAEGRLILCDALSYARRFSPSCVVDAATLTGAITICLGHMATGIMGNDPALIAELTLAGERAHERVWELPLWDEYRDLIKSDIADIKNSGGRPAGSISAGWFLKEFADEFRWAHLDIAATAYTEREDATMVKGPTGLPVRLFSEFLLARQG